MQMETNVSLPKNIGGVPVLWYSSVWWVIAVWNASFVFNVWAKTQQFGFALPGAPDFKDTATPYAVAAIGGIGGAVLLSIVAVGLWYYAVQTRGTSSGWLGRIPSVAKDISPPHKGTLSAIVQLFVLIVTVLFPVSGQLHFVDKYLSGRSTHIDNSTYADSWRGHLLAWTDNACTNYIYDGKPSASYCEFYEPWVVVICALVSVTLAALAVLAVFRSSR
jgi:hypothetical protein